MEASLKFAYDRDADILHIDKVKSYPQQEAEEIKNIEVLFSRLAYFLAKVFLSCR